MKNFNKIFAVGLLCATTSMASYNNEELEVTEDNIQDITQMFVNAILDEDTEMLEGLNSSGSIDPDEELLISKSFAKMNTSIKRALKRQMEKIFPEMSGNIRTIYDLLGNV